MKIAISIPDSLFDSAEKLAQRFGMSRDELFQRAVEAFVRDRRDEGITETLNAVYADKDDSRVDRLLDRLQLASLNEWTDSRRRN